MYISQDVCQHDWKHYKKKSTEPWLVFPRESPNMHKTHKTHWANPNFSKHLDGFGTRKTAIFESVPISEGYTHNTTQKPGYEIQSWFHKDFSISSKIIWKQHLLLVEKDLKGLFGRIGWWAENMNLGGGFNPVRLDHFPKDRGKD